MSNRIGAWHDACDGCRESEGNGCVAVVAPSSRHTTHLTMGGLHDDTWTQTEPGMDARCVNRPVLITTCTAILVNSQSVLCEHGQMERLWSQANSNDGKGESQWLIRVTTPCPLA